MIVDYSSVKNNLKIKYRKAITRKSSKEPEGIVDVGEMYRTYESEQAKLALDQIGPAALGLDVFDINMRRYRIVGGIYYVEHLEQPHQDTQLEKKKFLRTSILIDYHFSDLINLYKYV